MFCGVDLHVGWYQGIHSHIPAMSHLLYIHTKLLRILQLLWNMSKASCKKPPIAGRRRVLHNGDAVNFDRRMMLYYLAGSFLVVTTCIIRVQSTIY